VISATLHLDVGALDDFRSLLLLSTHTLIGSRRSQGLKASSLVDTFKKGAIQHRSPSTPNLLLDDLSRFTTPNQSSRLFKDTSTGRLRHSPSCKSTEYTALQYQIEISTPLPSSKFHPACPTFYPISTQILYRRLSRFQQFYCTTVGDSEPN
jgi:hypothetical protein